MDRKCKGLMKVPDDITYEHKYLERRMYMAAAKKPEPRLSAQGKQPWVRIQTSSKWWSFCEGKGTRTLAECPKDNNFELASRHQVRYAFFWEGKEPNLGRLSNGWQP